MIRLRYRTIFCGMFLWHESVSATDVDTLNYYRLQDVEVMGKTLRSQLSEVEGASIINMSLMTDMPHILGNADPVHYAQLLPGVQTNSEYDAGLHIQGCDNSHNYVSLDGVPIYNAAHLLGFFSVFNASHFADMSLRKSPSSASFPNRLGGSVDMRTLTWILAEDSMAMNGAHGEISVGPMSSQGTLRLPVGKRSLLLLSARAAYLNLLYSKWLEVDGDEVKYDFSDYNLSFVTQLDEHHVLKLDSYWGYDNMKAGQGDYALVGKLKWDNAMAALHWYMRQPQLSMEHTAYVSRYANRVEADDPSFILWLRSSILDLGYRGHFAWGRWNVGGELIRHQLLPQKILLTGSLANYSSDAAKYTSFESNAYAGYSLPIGDKMQLALGARFSSYYRQTHFAHLSPDVKLSWNMSSSSKLQLYLGIRHQYLFQTGFSSVGLPTEFWFSADKSQRPQYAYNASLQGEFWFRDREYRLSTDLYFKRLHHQVENDGNFFDVLYSAYSFESSLLHGKGYNYGLNVLLEKRRGKLTGWLSYSLGRAWRKFQGEQYPGWYPASHERIHELNAVATYRLGRRLSLGGTYVLASGTPYTPVNYVYLVSGNFVTEFGSHNSARVNPYMRLDLSLNYDFAVRDGRQSGINFSLYNASMHHNDLFYRIKIYKNHVSYRPFRFFMPILPSINYYYKF